MTEENQEKNLILPHLEQQPLCTTRLPYRQGKKLTAVKVYTVNSESNHLLIFGVPSLNLRQETKALFSKFGKLQNFSLATKYPAEPFTENYHAVFENIQSARIAKKMLDTKNFYGGSLHVCYAPDLETIKETRNKLFKRNRDVLNRIRNLNNDIKTKNKNEEITKIDDSNGLLSTSSLDNKNSNLESKINMGDYNVIPYENKFIKTHRNKRKSISTNMGIEKCFKPCFTENTDKESHKSDFTIEILQEKDSLKDNEPNITESPFKNKIVGEKSNEVKNSNNTNNGDIEIVDFTSTEKEIVTNIDETLNYNRFGNETIRKVPEKPINRIKFNITNKSCYKKLSV